MDSVVEACKEYIKALEIMEGHFKEKDLVGYKAKFMALVYSRLCVLFTDQYLHVQAVGFAKQAYVYYQKQGALSWQSVCALNKIGIWFPLPTLTKTRALSGRIWWMPIKTTNNKKKKTNIDYGKRKTIGRQQ